MTNPFVPPSDAAILAAWRSGTLGWLIGEVLDALVGQPLVEMGRAADLAWLGFGPVVHSPSPRDLDRRTAVHRLHIQCAFRLDGPSGPVAASHDIFADPRHPNDTGDDFAWDVAGSNLFDTEVADFWREHRDVPLTCAGVVADNAGGFVLELAAGHSVRVFPQASWVREHWRYFRAGEDSSHFVVLPER